MEGMSWKSIFPNRILMNIIEKNNENDSYMPRTICTGYTGAVTEGERGYVHPVGYFEPE
jgi:hypothetical protein